jgi:hypothetical protein
MKMNSKILGISGLAPILVFFATLALAEPLGASTYPLEVVQPKANPGLQSRFAKAYPGIEYNVRVAVVGGRYPYKFELRNAPDGMNVDARGTIVWPGPIERDSPYPVTVRVTDLSGNTTEVNWAISVTTQGFLFVDSRRGLRAEDGGKGTIGNPFRTMKDVYGGSDYNSKWANNFPGHFVYWRDGEYQLDAYIEDCHLNDCRVPWSGRKPLVWLGYPGESPVINMNANGRDARLFFYDQTDNLYLDGFEFNANGNTRGIAVSASTASNMTFRRNTFHGVTRSHPGGNVSLLFLTGGGGVNNVIQDNVFDGRIGGVGYGILGYGSYKTLVEDNLVRRLDIGISPKTDNRNWFIRGNSIVEMNSGARCFLVQAYPTTRDIEFSFNRVLCADRQSVRINNEYSDSVGSITLFRNTIVGSVEAIRTTTSNGPFTFDRNVIINASAELDKITRISIEDPKRLLIVENLAGAPSAGIVNTSGELTEAYREYLGTRGFQIGSNLAAPKAPIRLVVD